jgi:toxin-antitoxin system PIN domain toxin
MASHLLDVNALIALLWEDHTSHGTMARWYTRHAKAGWATCAITQAGFIRVMSQPALAQHGRSLGDLADALAHNVAQPSHRLLPLDFDFAEVMACCTGGVVGHRQVTDAYLLTAAMRAGMKLLTFDSGLGTLLASSAERSAHIELLR